MVKFTETVSRTVTAKGWGYHARELVFSGDRVTVGANEQGLELGNGESVDPQNANALDARPLPRHSTLKMVTMIGCLGDSVG